MKTVTVLATTFQAPIESVVPCLGDEQRDQELHDVALESGFGCFNDIDMAIKATDAVGYPSFSMFQVTTLDRTDRKRRKPLRFEDWEQPQKIPVKITKEFKKKRAEEKKTLAMLMCKERCTKSMFRPIVKEKHLFDDTALPPLYSYAEFELDISTGYENDGEDYGLSEVFA